MVPPIAFLPNVGIPELLILLAILVLIFGPKRIPQAARSLGRSLKNFRDSVSGEEKGELPEGEAEKAAPVAKATEESATTGEGKTGS
ncbi:MAG: twin-arginine translocase TatA/TatE family subunit [Solirubrobacterales bacterium]